MLLRGQGQSLECYWVKRSESVGFMPGFHAFPGGTAGPDDRLLPIEGVADERERALRACGIRETFEEVGILVASPGSFDPAGLDLARERLLSGERTFGELARELGWRFRAGDLVPAGRWRTPPFSSARFDTTYFLARVPGPQQPRIEGGELAAGEWTTAALALERWRRGEAAFAAPILHTLEEIARGEDGLAARLEAAPGRAGQPVRRIELVWGIVLHSMKTQPLPPATLTNAYLVGDGEMALIDPGSGDAEEMAALARLVEVLAAEGRKPAWILCTHDHPDHVGGVAAARERWRIPVAAHAATAGRVAADRVLADGDVVELDSPRAPWSLRAVHTPGHARGHLCFLHQRTRSLFSGDHVIGGSGTVIVDPPGGDMAEYVASLERLATLPVEFLFPGHGSPQGAAPRRIRGLLRHRRERAARVLAALDDRARSLAELLELAYADTDRALWKYAERSLLAHLLALEGEGRAARAGDRWRAR